jgi:cobalt-zinc-cadmium efflux system membrane fusion protein
VTVSVAIGAAGTFAIVKHADSGDAQHKEAARSQAVAGAEEPAASSTTVIALSASARAAAGIRVQPALLTAASEQLRVPGLVDTLPNRIASVTPPVFGKLVRIDVGVGDRVRAGQVLALIDSVDVSQAHSAVNNARRVVEQAASAVATAKAQVNEARVRADAASAALERQRHMAQAGMFSQAPRAAAQAEVSAAQTELAQAEAESQARSSASARAERLFAAQVASRAEMEDAQAQKRQSEARVAQARSRVTLATDALAREERVHKGGLLDKQVIDTASAEARAAQAAFATARRQEGDAVASFLSAKTSLATSQSNLGALEGSGHAVGSEGLIILHAPISGVVTERTATVGQAVERSSSLFRIENLNAVQVTANVPEANVARVKQGQTARVSVQAFPGRTFTGVVTSIGNRVDEKTRALPVRILVDNARGQLRAEMYADVSLGVGSPSKHVTVPLSAVDEDGDERFVYVETAKGFERRNVTLGPGSGKGVVIKSGVAAGERVAVAGVFVLKSEMKKDELKGDED